MDAEEAPNAKVGEEEEEEEEECSGEEDDHDDDAHDEQEYADGDEDESASENASAADTFANVLAAAYEDMRDDGTAEQMESVYVRKSITGDRLPADAMRKGSLFETSVRTEGTPRPPVPAAPQPPSPGPSATLVTPAVQKRAFRGSVLRRREFAGYLYKKPRTASVRSILNLGWQKRWFEISTHYLRYHRTHSDSDVLGASI